MMRRFTLFGLIAVLAVAVVGCGSDSVSPTPKLKDPYKTLAAKSDVLFNLQLAMNKMDATHYNQVLDPNDFTFYFDPGDVGGPNNIPASWGYAEESLCATKMLGGDGGMKSNPILSINLELVDFANASWTEYDPSGHPGVYETTVPYLFAMETYNSTSYITTGTERARFRVRQDNEGKWRLVEWNDYHTTLLASPAGPLGTEQSDWGVIKALYR